MVVSSVSKLAGDAPSLHAITQSQDAVVSDALAAVYGVPKGDPLKLRALDRIKPSAVEVAGNPRARSATLRVAERSEAALDPAVLNRIEPDAWRS